MTYYSWVITMYMLTSTISTIVFEKLSDIYGRKKILLIGISTFIVGSFLTGLSANIFQMITFRGVQGIGGGMLMSITPTAIGDLYPPEERAKWTGTMMAIFGLSSVLGPVLGGYHCRLDFGILMGWDKIRMGFTANHRVVCSNWLRCHAR